MRLGYVPSGITDDADLRAPLSNFDSAARRELALDRELLVEGFRLGFDLADSFGGFNSDSVKSIRYEFGKPRIIHWS